MIRCKYIIKTYKELNILKNVNKMSQLLIEGLSNIKNIKNIRNCGLLFAFDFNSNKQRDFFVKELLNNKMLCNPTRDKTVRLRPNLCLTADEANHALEIIKKVDQVL